jgi:hypothetical protein
LAVSPLLALLALALSPTIGRAEKPSSEIIYNPKPVPSIESEPKVVPSQPGTPAEDHPVPHTGTQKPAPTATSEAGTAPKATEPTDPDRGVRARGRLDWHRALPRAQARPPRGLSRVVDPGPTSQIAESTI